MYYKPTRLLTDNNSKTIKGEKKGWKTFILYLAPHKQNSLKVNICPNATGGCISACLYNSGMGKYSTVQKGRINKTEYFLHNQKDFVTQLCKELKTLEKKYPTNLAIRLNGTSDIDWTEIKIKNNKNIFQIFPNIQFYDYTKHYERFFKKIPRNYYLTFSLSEHSKNQAQDILDKGFNVAVVFDKLPYGKYMGKYVINGDKNDLRFLDKKDRIVGLLFKRSTVKRKTTAMKYGFIQIT